MHSVLSLILVIIVVIGCVNWMIYGLEPVGKNGLVHQALGNKNGTMSKAEKTVYVIIGLCGIAFLVKYLMWRGKHIHHNE
jgi:uncharacterized membrane protein YuzA (DUF378 family)